jgi:hypothetical protein
VLGQIEAQQRDDAVEVVALQHAHRAEGAGRGLQREARVRRADVGQQARAVGKGGARDACFGRSVKTVGGSCSCMRSGPFLSVPNQPP